MNRHDLVAGICALLVSVSTHSAIGAGLDGAFEDAYYKTWPLFNFYPAADVPRFKIDHIGPIGIGLELRQPAFTMHLISVEPGSPAAATGKLKPGQIIESINGEVLKDVDPRVILGNLITEAEAKDGVLKIMVKADATAKAEEVIVTIPVMGAYSDTWPLDCKKSDKVVREFADFLARSPRGHGAALFLLSTGEEKDLDVVRKWFGRGGGPQGNTWDIGYTGPAVCEYYLRTGDESVLPGIKSAADKLMKTIYNGSWMGRGGCNYNYMAGGHMNAAGVHCLTFLLLARECGVDVDEHTLQSCLYHFYRYAGHWNVAYGDGLPEGGGVDNGKNGGLAFAMAAAASLTPKGEASVYAKARDVSANKSFYTTSWLFHGHTGGGVGEIWRGAAAGLLYEKRPEMYRSFMKERAWMYELARRHDGAFGWASGMNVNYGTTGHNGGRAWGNYVPLIYTVPRKQLRMYGAPPTKYSKTYAIPERPWGTKADEAFYSLEPGEYKPGKKQDMSEERLPTHASWPLLRRLGNPKVSDDELLMFAHHPDSTGHGTASGKISALGRDHLLVELLKSKDPRARYAGVSAVSGARKGVPANADRLTDEIIELLGGMISDPEESWWVAMAAMKVMKLAPAEKVAPYVDALDKWLKHEDWWLRQAALQAVTPLATHKDYYKQILPVIGDMVASNQRAVGLSPLSGIVAAMNDADPKVAVYAADVLAKAYSKYPSEFSAPGGQNMSACVDYMLKGLARNLANTPGGFDKLYDVSRKRSPGELLPHKDLYMRADASKFGPTVKAALRPILIDSLIPKFVGYGDYRGNNSDMLLEEAASTAFSARPKMPELVALYNRIGITDYNWHDFGPERDAIAWQYHTFDPPEEKIWEPGWRYRKVTDPKGMENWMKPEFDAKGAGWKSGHAPFGQLDGKLPTEPIRTCTAPFCRCGELMKTLWDKEVLIMQTKVKFPKLKEGHIYRLVVGGMSHVQGGDGLEVYVNGKQLMQRKSGVGKRAGGKAVGAFITKAWWPDFEKEVVIAAKGFCPIPGGKRSPGVRRQHFSVWLQEMQAPPIPEEMIIKGKLLQPLLSSAWQTSKDNADKFTFDGEFAANKKVVGDWSSVAQVASVDAFKPEAEAGKPALAKVSLKRDGKTGDDMILWTGDTLMNLNKYEARKMQVKKVDGNVYLFVESGGFSNRNPADWKSPWTVMRRANGK
jgi:hypothetical protein